jgi:hypothetical protein
VLAKPGYKSLTATSGKHDECSPLARIDALLVVELDGIKAHALGLADVMNTLSIGALLQVIMQRSGQGLNRFFGVGLSARKAGTSVWLC